MKKIFLFIADGFEEVEAITPVDYLRRCGAQVVIVGVGGATIKSSRSVTITCDVSLDALIDPSVSGSTASAIDGLAAETALVILPGGLPNSRSLGENTRIRDFVQAVDRHGGLIGAICAAPVLTLGAWNMLDGKKFTCYPGMSEDLPVPPLKEMRVIQDGNIITACAAGAAEEFAFMLISVLYGAKKLQELKTSIAAR